MESHRKSWILHFIVVFHFRLFIQDSMANYNFLSVSIQINNKWLSYTHIVSCFILSVFRFIQCDWLDFPKLISNALNIVVRFVYVIHICTVYMTWNQKLMGGSYLCACHQCNTMWRVSEIENQVEKYRHQNRNCVNGWKFQLGTRYDNACWNLIIVITEPVAIQFTHFDQWKLDRCNIRIGFNYFVKRK